MGDEENGYLKLMAQFFKQGQNGYCRDSIKRRCRLIADKEARLKKRGTRDEDPLTLTAGELVRITSHYFFCISKSYKL